MKDYNKFAICLQEFFDKDVDELAKKTSFFQRKRKMTARTWLFGFLKSITGSNNTLEAFANFFKEEHISITKQGIHKKFTPACAEFLKEVLLKVMQTLVMQTNIETPQILQRFNGVYIGDCTTVSLPDSLANEYPGCGGGKDPEKKTAAMKIFHLIEVSSGEIKNLEFSSGKTSDRTFIKEKTLPPSGSLEMLDMGFTILDRLDAMTQNGMYFITRIRANSSLYINNKTIPLSDFLSSHKRSNIDIECRLGGKRIPIRLVAIPVKQSVSQKRIEDLKKEASKNQRNPSKEQIETTKWTFYATNIPADKCTLEDIFALYSIRWQIELIFKLWKSEGGLGQSTCQSSIRSVCEIYGRLLNIIISNWLMLVRGGRLSGVSAVKLFRCVHKNYCELLTAIKTQKKSKIIKVIKKIVLSMNEIQPMPHRKNKRITTLDLINNSSKIYEKYAIFP